MRRYAFLALTAAALSAFAVPAIEAAQATVLLHRSEDARPPAVTSVAPAMADFTAGRQVRIVYGAPVILPLRSPR